MIIKDSSLPCAIPFGVLSATSRGNKAASSPTGAGAVLARVSAGVPGWEPAVSGIEPPCPPHDRPKAAGRANNASALPICLIRTSYLLLNAG